jgi:hypothetical protein
LALVHFITSANVVDNDALTLPFHRIEHAPVTNPNLIEIRELTAERQRNNRVEVGGEPLDLGDYSASYASVNPLEVARGAR